MILIVQEFVYFTKISTIQEFSFEALKWCNVFAAGRNNCVSFLLKKKKIACFATIETRILLVI